jgi:HPt (histidine-containing phosphotransfer) domain-containing protein
MADVLKMTSMNPLYFNRAAVLTTLKNNVELYESLCGLFIATAPKMMSDLQEAAQRPNALDAARACHMLRGSALILQADRLVSLLADSEEALRANRPVKDHAWLENIAVELERVLQEVEASLPLTR